MSCPPLCTACYVPLEAPSPCPPREGGGGGAQEGQCCWSMIFWSWTDQTRRCCRDQPTVIFLLLCLTLLQTPPPAPPVHCSSAVLKCSFLDSLSESWRTTLQLTAKTPYLCLAATGQDGGVRVKATGCEGEKYKTKQSLVEIIGVEKIPSHYLWIKLKSRTNFSLFLLKVLSGQNGGAGSLWF